MRIPCPVCRGRPCPGCNGELSVVQTPPPKLKTAFPELSERHHLRVQEVHEFIVRHRDDWSHKHLALFVNRDRSTVANHLYQHNRAACPCGGRESRRYTPRNKDG